MFVEFFSGLSLHCFIFMNTIHHTPTCIFLSIFSVQDNEDCDECEEFRL
jgi:hypothetical protein